MMAKLWYFPSPEVASVTLRADNGFVSTLSVDTHPTGRVGKSCEIPNDKINGGASLDLRAPDFDSLHLRGLLILNPDDKNLVGFLNDDAALNRAVVVPPNPNPVPGSKQPFQIIQEEFAAGNWAGNLLTTEQCGKFTEACCKRLHNECSSAFGYIATSGAQNGYNGHRADKVQLLSDIRIDGVVTSAAVYDIIQNSESAEAKPAWTNEGGPIPGLYLYPAKGQA